ncbi:Cystathionine beta-lyase MetC [Methylobacterium crusticola]|uniref:Cystathionine beta-lyase MetC n=1 Tax=Methylobacterium crusticola TaxID=1697972 RepID=A0ABQ4R3F7_9HYPH|nr:cystathionine beta-lyase [Methylobacterium crusticola]GJD52153.1 Cystathionine beta-lyase MetC [Methylobacterium crusticola]
MTEIKRPVGRRDWRTRLIQPEVGAPGGFVSLVPAVHRGSTVVFERLADAQDDWRTGRYTYGLYGTPTVLELGARIADLEGAHHSFVVPGGQAAIVLIYLAFCTAGSHALVPESAYGPNQELGPGLLEGLGITVETYPPTIGAGIADRIRPATRLIWCESPGSITMEVQDVPAIVAAAHARDVPVALDNTYAAGILFDAFAAGVDLSMQALTKYVGGHSDLLLGSVSVRDDAAYARVGPVHRLLGLAVSPDDCALALRGLETLAVRLAALERSTLAIATWLKARPEVGNVLHPGLPDCPGHAIWQRDFTGSASVFSFVFADEWDADRVARFVDALRLFRIGYSWGGTTSLVMAYPAPGSNARSYGARLVRLNVGLEATQDLIGDLEHALALAEGEQG